MSFLKYLFNNTPIGHGRQSGNHHGSGSHGKGGYSASPSSTLVCPKCHITQANDARFCSQCGVSLRSPTCTCGATLSVGAKFCAQCGQAS